MKISSSASRSTLAKAAGRQIRNLREKQGWTLEALAVLLRLPTRSLQAYEQGRQLPRAYTLYRLAHHFGVSVDYLLGMNSPSEQQLKDVRLRTALRNCESLSIPLQEAFIEFIEYSLAALRKLQSVRLAVRGESQLATEKATDSVQ